MLAATRGAVQQPAPESLRGRVVLVTGVSGGLGGASALACARAGATVVLCGRKVKPLEAAYDAIEAIDGAAQPAIYPLNLEGATPDDYAGLADAVQQQCGRLDGIVHAAAHFDGLRPVDQSKPDDWLRAQHVNHLAPFLLTQACLPLLRQADDGAIVFVFDDPARSGKAYWGGYGVAKAALGAFAAILHDETESGTLRVHGLLPAPMRTALRRMAYFGESAPDRDAPDAAGAAAAWLLTPQAADWRGRTLDLRTD